MKGTSHASPRGVVCPGCQLPFSSITSDPGRAFPRASYSTTTQRRSFSNGATVTASLSCAGWAADIINARRRTLSSLICSSMPSIGWLVRYGSTPSIFPFPGCRLRIQSLWVLRDHERLPIIPGQQLVSLRVVDELLLGRVERQRPPDAELGLRQIDTVVRQVLPRP